MEDKLNWTKTLNKDRASGVIIESGRVLLIHRIRGDKEYWVFPGGSVEDKETVEEALNRELTEELGINIKQKVFLFKVENAGRFEHYFLINEYDGRPKMGGPELQMMNQENQYILEERNLNKLFDINLLPEGIDKKLLEFLSK